MKLTTLAIGDAVRWTSSNTKKEGVVAAVVPASKLPSEMGYKGVGNGSLPRRYESYVIRGGEPGGKRQTFYWPMVSLLERAEGLTAAEVAWCHANAPLVRELMKSRDTP